MSVGTVFLDFAENMTQICMYQRTIKSQTNLELSELFEQKKIRAERNLELRPRSANRMIFYSALTGAIDAFGGRVQTVDQSIAAAIAHKNKLYQWLIAEAYEAFDKYLTHTYVFLGMENIEIWPLSDFANHRLSEVESMDWHKRFDLIKNKQAKANHILTQIRKCFPTFEQAEQQNALNVNFRVLINMYQKFRHHIVHDGGFISEPEVIVKKILDDSAVNGRYREAQESVIRSHIAMKDGRWMVYLLEENSELPPLSGLGAHFDVCDHLLKLLVSYAHLIKEVVIQKPHPE